MVHVPADQAPRQGLHRRPVLQRAGRAIQQGDVRRRRPARLSAVPRQGVQQRTDAACGMMGVMTKGDSDYEDKNNKRAFDCCCVGTRRPTGLMSEEPHRPLQNRPNPLHRSPHRRHHPRNLKELRLHSRASPRTVQHGD